MNVNRQIVDVHHYYYVATGPQPVSWDSRGRNLSGGGGLEGGRGRESVSSACKLVKLLMAQCPKDSDWRRFSPHVVAAGRAAVACQSLFE